MGLGILTWQRVSSCSQGLFGSRAVRVQTWNKITTYELVKLEDTFIVRVRGLSENGELMCGGLVHIKVNCHRYAGGHRALSPCPNTRETRAPHRDKDGLGKDGGTDAQSFGRSVCHNPDRHGEYVRAHVTLTRVVLRRGGVLPVQRPHKGTLGISAVWPKWSFRVSGFRHASSTSVCLQWWTRFSSCGQGLLDFSVFVLTTCSCSLFERGEICLSLHRSRVIGHGNHCCSIVELFETFQVVVGSCVQRVLVDVHVFRGRGDAAREKSQPCAGSRNATGAGIMDGSGGHLLVDTQQAAY